MQASEPTIGGDFSLEQIEIAHIKALLKNNNLRETAKIAGIDQATLFRKRKRWGLKVQRTLGYQLIPAPTPEAV